MLAMNDNAVQLILRGVRIAGKPAPTGVWRYHQGFKPTSGADRTDSPRAARYRSRGCRSAPRA
ncbi:hypothetical protein CCU68_12695 [Pseudomonas gingeri NCPPB 3146 = LMG 5327]|uniref:DUF1534 domain-containing protein n=1 Tax=Pseudomonas gingeri NCPPB 3146 = LMG 5327 TaxID=707248 RepID=A0ABX4Y5F8_9PSED|nr:hypothetical protein CCU68_12695 [Pseudomonas gingeri NCPPB 3146 = LMG 5327]